ncbi:unnamed protein product [Phytophthora lilii]|uniref:Unnamed protein product n=1 Tax=Phytophthora lilii TaxID=2077276 RepID=A0A9W6XY93_9STRA|nr:unnamed protein product [Phytophthora lilii]
MNCKDYLYEIDCKLTQYCYPMEEPDQGYFIRQQLIREIEDYNPNLSTICKDYLYEIDCKLTQYCYPMEEPDQGDGLFCHLHKNQQPTDIIDFRDLKFFYRFVKKQILSGLLLDENDDDEKLASLLSIRQKIGPILKKAEDVKFVILFDRCIKEVAFHPCNSSMTSKISLNPWVAKF